ncbi:MOSC domain-containing protein [Stigmatella sp. ncwal1]|uniref:MOSC domain-containing protein n=1 Tax=Stigmatella ashevillensis TaxID=2995309 RepID=A0ABT5DMX9_9BACT|nr:MOSC domain-containing protein [Stigmatella ashevillena]MDC0714493.1 MOSC domain-containing protein [Stigmatella ashevillena]
MPTVAELFLYPLKSAAGLPLTEAQVEPLGVAHDRRWMVASPKGSFFTGRKHPALLRINALPSATGLRLSAPGVAGLEVPVPPLDAPRLDVTIWDDTCSAARAGEAADRWLSAFLGEPVCLVYVDDRMERPVDSQYSVPGDKVGFADGFPLLLLSRASLEALNQRLARPVTMLHFRPNLVVEGCEPFAEDTWKRLRIGNVELEVASPCARCVMVTLDPQTAEQAADGEPLRTLTTFRRQLKNKVMFGQNVVVRRPGRFQVGDAVEVLE